MVTETSTETEHRLGTAAIDDLIPGDEDTIIAHGGITLSHREEGLVLLHRGETLVAIAQFGMVHSAFLLFARDDLDGLMDRMGFDADDYALADITWMSSGIKSIPAESAAVWFQKFREASDWELQDERDHGFAHALFESDRLYERMENRP